MIWTSSNHDIMIIIWWGHSGEEKLQVWWPLENLWIVRLKIWYSGNKFWCKKQWARKDRALNHLKLRGWDEQYDSKLQLQNLQTSGSKWWPIFSHKIVTKFQPQYLDQCQFQNLDQTSASKSQLSFNFKTLTKPQPRYLTQSSAKNPLPNCCQHFPYFAP